MGTCNDYSLLGLTLVEDKFRERVNWNSKFLSSDKFWVINSSMHSQNDSIDLCVYFIWKPTLFGRKDPRFLKTSFGWLVNFIVATGNMVPFFEECKCKIVHDRASYSNEMVVFHVG